MKPTNWMLFASEKHPGGIKDTLFRNGASLNEDNICADRLLRWYMIALRNSNTICWRHQMEELSVLLAIFAGNCD